MGYPSPLGLAGFGTPPYGDGATAVLSGSFTETGVSSPFAFYGSANFTLYCQVENTISTTQGSSTATVTGSTASLIEAGTSIYTALFQSGSVFSAYSAGSGTIAFQPLGVYGDVTPLSDIITGYFPTDGNIPGTDITGSVITGYGIPDSTTISEIIVHSDKTFIASSRNPNKVVIRLSQAATELPNLPNITPRTALTIYPSTNMLPTDSNSAFFTGSSLPYTGSVQLEKSYDGGYTWIVANIGPPGSGALAIYQNASSVSFSLFEPEKQVLYRWNCTSLTLAGSNDTVQYRISQTGSLNTSMPI